MSIRKLLLLHRKNLILGLGWRPDQEWGLSEKHVKKTCILTFSVSFAILINLLFMYMFFNLENSEEEKTLPFYVNFIALHYSNFHNSSIYYQSKFYQSKYSLINITHTKPMSV